MILWIARSTFDPAQATHVLRSEVGLVANTDMGQFAAQFLRQLRSRGQVTEYAGVQDNRIDRLDVMDDLSAILAFATSSAKEMSFNGTVIQPESIALDSDGLFRAISSAIYGSSDANAEIRSLAVRWLQRAYPDREVSLSGDYRQFTVLVF